MTFFFFFSSRRRHTRFSRDWSSDVCSSDLGDHQLKGAAEQEVAHQHARLVAPEDIGRSLAAPEIAFVDHIVVEEGGGVDELNAGCEARCSRARMAAQLR